VESALTVTVTHVVATDVGSAKYNVGRFSAKLAVAERQYAIEGRIPVMTPEWIKESHEIWLRGDQIDLPWMQQEYRMQPFQGLKIAISGIEDCTSLGNMSCHGLTLVARRKAIKHYVDTNGGEYSKDLDRTCTHLVTPTSTSTPKQSEKVKWALREIASSEAARRRGGKRNEHTMKLVYEEWLWDCLGYRGRFKEDDYDARKPRPKARIQAGECCAVLDRTRANVQRTF
jgi:DNA replication regulator DPB11